MTNPEGSLASTGALVTGATSGFGRAVAVRMTAAGADVALLGRNGRGLAKVAAEGPLTASARARQMPRAPTCLG